MSDHLETKQDIILISSVDNRAKSKSSMYYVFAKLLARASLCVCLGYVVSGWNWSRQRREFFYTDGVTRRSVPERTLQGGPSNLMWILFSERASSAIGVSNEADAVEARRLFPEAEIVRVDT
jgi:hypothetical protein